jgi:hypothetical protein
MSTPSRNLNSPLHGNEVLEPHGRHSLLNILSDGWSTGDGTSSLTVSNLEQHNQQQLRPEPTLPVFRRSSTQRRIPIRREVPQQAVLRHSRRLISHQPRRVKLSSLPPPNPAKNLCPSTKATVSQVQPQQLQQQRIPRHPVSPK